MRLPAYQRLARIVISRDVEDAERAWLPLDYMQGRARHPDRAQARHAGPRQAFPRNTRLDRRGMNTYENIYRY